MFSFFQHRREQREVDRLKWQCLQGPQFPTVNQFREWIASYSKGITKNDMVRMALIGYLTKLYEENYRPFTYPEHETYENYIAHFERHLAYATTANIDRVLSIYQSLALAVVGHLPQWTYARLTAHSGLTAQLGTLIEDDDAYLAQLRTALAGGSVSDGTYSFNFFRSLYDYREIGRNGLNGYTLIDRPLHLLEQAWLPVIIPNETRNSGTWVVAPQGKGKTNLTRHLVSHDLWRSSVNQCAVIIFDSKGDLIDPLIRINWGGHLNLIEASELHPLALNPLDLGSSSTHSIAFVEYLFGGLLASNPTALQNTLLRSVLLALREIDGANLSTFQEIIRDGWKTHEKAIRRTPETVRNFFLKGEFDSKTYAETKQQVLWRIRDLTTRVPMLAKMFDAPKTKIDMAALMDKPGFTVISLPKKVLGDEGVAFLSRFFLAMIRNAAVQRADRPDSKKLPVALYIDEAADVIANDGMFPKIITECRSQKIAITVAHQYVSQIKNDDVKAALKNCAVRFANSDDEARELASVLRTDTEHLQSLRVGQFAIYVRDMITKGLTVRVPFVDLDVENTIAHLSNDEMAKLRAEMRARYSITRVKEPVLIGAPDAETDADPDNPSY